MATLRAQKSPMRFSLDKKGQLEFVFSKFAFLVFGLIITACFFYFIAVQKDVQLTDENARTAEAIANIVGAASASPFQFSILYEPRINATLNFTNTTFDISSQNKILTHPIYFPINTTGIVDVRGCVNITRTNITEVLECP